MRVLADASTLDEAAPAILRGVGEALEWSFGALWVVHDAHGGDRLRAATIWKSRDPGLERFAEMSGQLQFASGEGLPGRVWASGEAAWIEDVQRDSNFPRAPAAKEAGLHCAASFPIRVGGSVFGVVELFGRDARPRDDELIETLSVIGGQLGRLIERERTRRELELQKAILEYQGEAALEGIGVIGPNLRILYWNRRMVEMFGLTVEELEGSDATAVIQRIVAATADPDGMSALADAVLRDPESSRRIEAVMADGRVFDAWTAPVRAPDGTILGRVLYCRDATEQKRREERLRESERWHSFLAEVSAVMSQSLDPRVSLERLAQMAVPMLADWCAIHVVSEQADIEQVAIAHTDEERLAAADRMRKLFPVDPQAEVGLAQAVRSGTSLLFEEVDDRLLAAAARNDEHLQGLRSLGIRSAMIVPLICRERVLGTLTLLSAESGRRFTKEDLRLAEDVALRAAFPIDNARLYAQREVVAQTLQSSLLPPELPEIPGVELAARYHAVVRTAEVGGDFYDAFAAGPKSWGIALGDVSGKGVEAAAVTSLARHTLRAATMATQRPSRILSMLNAALLEETERDRFSTAVYALVEPRFARVDVTVSCGGHPPPYVVRSDGTLEQVESAGTLLGVVPDPKLDDVTIELNFGDKLIMYTDGILDVRPPPGTVFGQRELEELLRDCAKRGVSASAELISRSILDLQHGETRDDFAIVIVGVRASIFRRARSSRPRRRAKTPA